MSEVKSFWEYLTAVGVLLFAALVMGLLVWCVWPNSYRSSVQGDLDDGSLRHRGAATALMVATRFPATRFPF